MTEREIIEKGLALLADKYDTQAARVMLAVIAFQESNFHHRRQIKGPARGLWQFERGGGVVGVMRHRSTEAAARELCDMRGIPFDSETIYNSLEFDDLLACGFARLLLWTHPKALPTDPAPAWQYYLDVWRPGKPHPQRWSACWEKATEMFQ